MEPLYDLANIYINLSIADIIGFTMMLIMIMIMIIMILDIAKFHRSYEEDKKLAHYDEMVLEN